MANINFDVAEVLDYDRTYNYIGPDQNDSNVSELFALKVRSCSSYFNNKVFIANKNIINPIKGLSGIYLSAFNRKILTSSYFQEKSIIGSAHSFSEIREKIKSKCNIIFLSPVLKKKEDKPIKPIGIIKFLLISKHFKNITLYPLGGICNPSKLKNYGIKGFAGVNCFDKKNI